ncbi:hypothetical protein GOBAR_AA31060 [Gossypium barbadense]|uniref:Uncharacterized protein n=1 Tax=Gossypium barbadense TaxID=3634 RepID=A0A2P5WEX0_GOSBA|nr:hypothetical protein GOBAR_AA31060 [Gossypium barbadense]
MALTVTLSHGSSSSGGNGVRSLYNKPSKHFYPRFPHRHHILFPVSPFSSRTGHFDNKNRRGSLTTKEQDEEKRTPEIEDENVVVGISLDNVGVSSSKVSADRKPFPELPGTRWDVLSFLIQYLWAFGIVFALIACGISVATYNEGATDFKETPVENVLNIKLFSHIKSKAYKLFIGYSLPFKTTKIENIKI